MSSSLLAADTGSWCTSHRHPHRGPGGQAPFAKPTRGKHNRSPDRTDFPYFYLGCFLNIAGYGAKGSSIPLDDTGTKMHPTAAERPRAVELKNGNVSRRVLIHPLQGRRKLDTNCILGSFLRHLFWLLGSNEDYVLQVAPSVRILCTLYHHWHSCYDSKLLIQPTVSLSDMSLCKTHLTTPVPAVSGLDKTSCSDIHAESYQNVLKALSGN